ncbi:hypothetical protein GCM10007898_08340 [Dyella flagellata]|uniref:Uncharacterized protein n=1 Tax=Dyella flagellata TaxID=1867833 RepID=A0ABQ5X9K5_9GAMM|nr:hypothetical protein GCM10007898_08340 [Dyella flagellata]
MGAAMGFQGSPLGALVELYRDGRQGREIRSTDSHRCLQMARCGLYAEADYRKATDIRDARRGVFNDLPTR